MNTIPPSSLSSGSTTLKFTNSTVINTIQRTTNEKIDENIADRVDSGTMTSIATITEPDCLGPCEPGTSVTLEGIVWQETENGIYNNLKFFQIFVHNYNLYRCFGCEYHLAW